MTFIERLIMGSSIVSIINKFQRKVVDNPHATAIVSITSSCTYRTLDEVSDEICARLKHLSIPDRSIIAIVGDQSPYYVSAVLGIMKHNSIFLPLGTRTPPERIRSIFSAAQPSAIIITGKNKTDIDGLVKEFKLPILALHYEFPLLESRIDVVQTNESEVHRMKIDNDDVCYIIPTSGSTGVPKLILGSARGLLHFIEWEIERLKITNEFRISALSAPTFDVSLRDMFTTLFCGATMYIPHTEYLIDGRMLYKWFIESRITLTHIVPSIFRLLLIVIESQSVRHSLSHLKFILLAGEALYYDDISRWRSIEGNNSVLVNLYGPSETTLAKVCYFIDDTSHENSLIVPLGYPISDTIIFILNDEDKLCQTGIEGQICISTPHKSYGYLGMPELTEKQFVNAEKSTGFTGSIYKTGDRGMIDEHGLLHFSGRIGNHVKIHGNRVEIGDLEVCLRRHSDIMDVAVKVFGEKNPQIVAFCVKKKSSTISVLDLREYVLQLLPAYMLPSTFHLMDELPRTHSGKVDRNALVKPVRNRPDLTTEYISPSNRIEIIIADIWKDLLQIENVGINDNFFDLGGTSLLAGHYLVEINDKLNTNFQITIILQFPTVARLARYIELGECGETDSTISERAFKRRSAVANRRRISEESGDSA